MIDGAVISGIRRQLGQQIVIVIFLFQFCYQLLKRPRLAGGTFLVGFGQAGTDTKTDNPADGSADDDAENKPGPPDHVIHPLHAACPNAVFF